MKKYIGTKLIEAERAFKIGDKVYSNENGEIDKVLLGEGEVAVMGYKVRYADGYESFSPKAVFEKAYMPLEPNKKLKTDAPSISQKMVDDFIDEIHVSTLGEKTAVVRVVLVNGFEIVESSSCVSKENYDQNLGRDICMEKIKGKIWYLLGFLLQTAVGGIEKHSTMLVQEGWSEPVRDLEQEYENQVKEEQACDACDCGNGNCSCDEDADKVDVTIHASDTMTLNKTVGLMMSADFKDRAKAEYHQLKIRCEKLEDMCKKYAAGELGFTPNCPLELLKKQLGYMQNYKAVLELRAEIEGIDLQDLFIADQNVAWALTSIDKNNCKIEGNCGSLINLFYDALTTEKDEGEELQCCEGCSKE